MAKEVIKRDGEREAFNGDKIRAAIAAAARMAGLEEEKKNEIVERVVASVLKYTDQKEVLPTTEIEVQVLKELDKNAPSVAAAWRKYRAEKVK